MSQLPLLFPAADAWRAEDYVVTPRNEEAYAHIARWPDWPQPAALLLGPSGSGKTHLARLWAGASGASWLAPQDAPASGAAVIDDADAWPEDALFHRLNDALLARSPLLVAASSFDGVLLPDLRSRLALLLVLRLPETDDTLLEAVLRSEFARRQLAVPPEVVRYLLAHAPRSPEGMRRLAGALDQAALAERRPVTLQLARSILFDSGEAKLTKD